MRWLLFIFLQSKLSTVATLGTMESGFLKRLKRSGVNVSWGMSKVAIIRGLNIIITVKSQLTAISLIWPPHYYGHFCGCLAKTSLHFLVKKPSLIYCMATWLIRPDFFGPLVTILTGFHCICLLVKLTSFINQILFLVKYM